MSGTKNRQRGRSVEVVVPAPGDFGEIANELCEKAMQDAKEQ